MSLFLRIGHRPILGAVLGGVTIIPLMHGVAATVSRDGLVKRLSEGHGQTVAVGMPGNGQQHRFGSITNALQRAVLECAGLPAPAARDIEMPVDGIERAAV